MSNLSTCVRVLQRWHKQKHPALLSKVPWMVNRPTNRQGRPTSEGTQQKRHYFFLESTLLIMRSSKGGQRGDKRAHNSTTKLSFCKITIVFVMWRTTNRDGMDICQTVEHVPRTLRQLGFPLYHWTLVGNAGHDCSNRAHKLGNSP